VDSEEALEGGTLQQTFFSSTSLLSFATPLKRAQPHLIPFVENTKKTTQQSGWSWLEGNEGGSQRPRQKRKRPAWLLAIFRRAE